jgi:hypothetical protein
MRRGLLVVSSLALSTTFSIAALPRNATAENALTSAVACATLRLTVRPTVNAQTAPYETIKSTVKSCASSTERVTLQQRITGSFRPVHSPATTFTIKLTSGQRVVKTRHIPWSCCGSYTVIDKVLSTSQHLLAMKRAEFTFA